MKPSYVEPVYIKELSKANTSFVCVCVCVCVVNTRFTCIIPPVTQIFSLCEIIKHIHNKVL